MGAPDQAPVRRAGGAVLLQAVGGSAQARDGAGVGGFDVGSDAESPGDRMSFEPHDDGFRLPEVGRWAKHKYHVLNNYLRTFSTAMKNK
jgi:hypothetical protein